MAAAVAEPPFAAKEEDTPFSSPSASASPSASSSSPPESPPPSPHAADASAAASMTNNPNSSPEPDPCSPNSHRNFTKNDPAADPAHNPAAIVARLLPSQTLFAGGGSASNRRLPPPCWTQEETDALIQSYRQKWYALRRGNLRASHWQEVADAVARRCRHLYTPAATNNPKTAVQCRHKMEKLRKRYRSEKKRPHRMSWVHFREMDAMEMGTPPGGGGAAVASRTKAVLMASVPEYSDDNEDDESDEESDDNDDEDDEEGPKNAGGTLNIHAVMSKANDVPEMGDLRFQIPKAVRSKVGTSRADDRVNPPPNHASFNPKPFHAGGSNGCFKGFPGGGAARMPPSAAAEEMRKRVEGRRRKEREEGAVLGDVVTAVRMLGDGFMGVEEMKMEMARDMEKLRMEMELKRTEMILESQQWIVDAFVKGLTHGKKKKKKQAKIASEP